MKKLIILMLLFPMLFWAQENTKHKRYGQKIAELEKIKLMDYLDLDEDTSIQFFARRNEHRKALESKMMELRKSQRNLEEMIEDDAEDDGILKVVKSILKSNQELAKMKSDFIDSLRDLLTPVQIGKVIVFEAKFQKEIRKFLYKRRKKNTR